MIDIRQLQVFLAVWEHRSFSKAARAVFLTQPTVSGHMKTLEDALGIRLFDRTGRNIFPTKAGELLYPYAKKALKIMDEITEEINLFKGADGGQIFLGGSNIPGQYILPRILGEFKWMHPKIEVMLSIGDSRSVTEMLLEREIDIGMVGAVFESDHLEFIPTFEDRLVLISRPGLGSAFANGITIPQVLYELPMVFREEGSGTRLMTETALKEQAGVDLKKLKIVAEMGSTEAVKQGVKSGMGYAIVSERSVKDEVQHGAIECHSIHGLEIRRHFYLMWDRRRSLSPTCMALKDFILKKAEEEKGK